MTPVPELNDLVETVGDRCPGGSELDRLRAASELAREVRALGEDLVTRFVDEARAAGASWSDVGEVLGVSRQGAHQRHQARVPEQSRQILHSRFTPRAVRAVTLAIEEAQRRGAPEVGLEHVLLGVLAVEGNVGLQAIEALGVGGEQLRAEVLARLPDGGGAGDPRDGRAHRPFTPDTRRLHDLAIGEALAFGHNYVGCEHIVLVLAEAEGVPREAMQALGLDVAALRQEIVRILASL
jgi:hypothetical protein